MSESPLPCPSTIRVALVEDDLFFVQSFVGAIGAAADMELTAVAHNCAEARALLATPAAHVLLVDLGLPDGSGVDIIRAAQQAWPDCLVLVSTVFGDEAHVMQSLEAGAAGYLLKDSSTHRIVDEIRSASGGGSPISPLIARQLLARFRGPAVGSSRPQPLAAGAGADEQIHLSPREHLVLEYVTKGFSYEEIAGLMGVTRNTVLSYVRRTYSKLKVRSQIEAIHEARSLGLLSD